MYQKNKIDFKFWDESWNDEFEDCLRQDPFRQAAPYANGAIKLGRSSAKLERLSYTQEVAGSSPAAPTN